MTIRKANPDKNLRVTWEPGGNLDVYVYAKGEVKTQCTADHNKLTSADEVEQYRAHWSAALDRLKCLLEG